MAQPSKELQYAESLVEMSRGMLSKLHYRGAPKQAILRKCTSNAYYAVFHCISNGGAKVLHVHDNARVFSARAFKHAQIKTVFEQQLNANLNSSAKEKKYRPYFTANSLEHIVSLSEAFVLLQIKRHQADYDFEVKFEKSDVIDSLNNASNAIQIYHDLYESYRENLKTMTSILLYEKISQVL